MKNNKIFKKKTESGSIFDFTIAKFKHSSHLIATSQDLLKCYIYGLILNVMSPEKIDQSKTTKLPSEEEMRKRLESVIEKAEVEDKDKDFDKYHSKVVGVAGERMTGEEIVLSLLIPSVDYSVPRLIRARILASMPQYLEDLIDDEVVQQDALDYWQELITPDQRPPTS